MLVIDGHNDALKQAFLSGRSLLERSASGHLDLPRATQGGLKAGIFSIHTPPETAEERAWGYGLSLRDDGWEVAYARPVAQAFAARFVDDVLRWFAGLRLACGEIHLVSSVESLEQALAGDGLGVILHFEGAEAIREDLSNLDEYYAAGLRSLGLV